jgi:deoxyribose-phosphate aldolase
MQLAKYIEQTNIKPTATRADILNLCEEALQYRFFAVAVMPTWLSLVVDQLKGSDVRVAVGIGVPSGADTQETKLFAARQAMQFGAEAVDVVMNISAFKSGDFETVKNEIISIVKVVKDKSPLAEVKVIIECCYLNHEEKVVAARLVEKCGADIVKTSTGLGPSGATVEDVKLLRATVSPSVKVKAAGGIKTRKQALAMIEAGAERIGTSSGVKIVAKEVVR